MSRKLTPNQQEWKKEVRRLQQFIRRAKKRGYIIPPEIIPEKPTIITKKQLSKIKSINPQKIYEAAQYFNPETGKLISGTAGRAIERRKTARKIQQSRLNKRQYDETALPRETDTVLQNVRDIINQFTPSNLWSDYWAQKKEGDKNKLQSLLDTVIAQEGEKVVADRLQNYAGDIERLLNSILYGSDEEQVQFDMVEFATIIKGRSLTLQESSDLTDLMEGQETE